jgi:replicative superfamily II helicase
MLARSANPATLLIAPTGGGKTLAGFLPTLAELGQTPAKGLHTLYISPLKALTADIRRNLRTPVEGASLPIRIEDRTGDTTIPSAAANAPTRRISCSPRRNPSPCCSPTKTPPGFSRPSNGL